jgi:Cu(I)/Ag(I) efflux system membrane fusion protein
MNRNLILILAFIATIAIGIVIGRQWAETATATGTTGAAAEREILYWVAPMDPNFRRDEPGKSPMGMDLVPVYADEVDSERGTVKIDPTVINNLGVRTAAAGFGSLSRMIETVGYVGYDEESLTHIHTRVDGWIEKLTVTSTGDPVAKGEVLFELYSPTLVNAQEEFLVALRSQNRALDQASRERLAALGMTEGEIDRLARERKVEQRIRVYAERDGVVAHLGVREGIYVTPATNVMSLAELDKVWVLAEVFERQAAWVAAGQEAEVTLDYLPGERWQGRVDYVYPELDPKTRALKVRLRLDNESVALLPNMFARVTIHGDAAPAMVHIPREALIRGGPADRVVLDLGGGRYRAQPVTVGIESGDRVAIRDGLSRGDRVVTSAQFLIDSESNIESALKRMGAPAMDHSGHDMGSDEPAMDHSGHDMGSDEPAMDHSGHDMGSDEPAMDHSMHETENMR